MLEDFDANRHRHRSNAVYAVACKTQSGGGAIQFSTIQFALKIPIKCNYMLQSTSVMFFNSSVSPSQRVF